MTTTSCVGLFKQLVTAHSGSAFCHRSVEISRTTTLAASIWLQEGHSTLPPSPISYLLEQRPHSATTRLVLPECFGPWGSDDGSKPKSSFDISVKAPHLSGGLGLQSLEEGLIPALRVGN